jgi:hypothetical protein
MPLCQKSLLAVLVSLLISFTFPTVVQAQALTKAHPKKSFINPTGTYILKGQEKGDETYGYFGHVYVQYVAKRKVVVKFYICKGYMSYSSGRFYDTLLYQNNTAVYGPAEYDSTCKIILRFYPNRVVVDEQTANFNNGCDFGHGVVANAIFRKKTSRSPTKGEMAEN